jgi:putative FmdB family regulatory protein
MGFAAEESSTAGRRVWGAWYNLRFVKLVGGQAVPLYEYQCTKCKRRTEKIESVAGPHLKKCPHCGGKVERLQSAPAIQFKGSGWYVTDYAGKSGGKEPEATKTDKTESKEAPKEAAAKETKESKESKEKKTEKKKN